MEESFSTLQQQLWEALNRKEYKTCTIICEELELQSALQGQTFGFYTLFFFLLLLQDNCNLAHFLWKRVPHSQREPRLVTLREIALALLREDYETAFSLCKNTDWQEWNPLAHDFLEVWRARLTEKLQSTYTVISVKDCYRYLGISNRGKEEEWMGRKKPCHWRIQGEYVFLENASTSLLKDNTSLQQEEDPLETLTRHLIGLAKPFE